MVGARRCRHFGVKEPHHTERVKISFAHGDVQPYNRINIANGLGPWPRVPVVKAKRDCGEPVSMHRNRRIGQVMTLPATSKRTGGLSTGEKFKMQLALKIISNGWRKPLARRSSRSKSGDFCFLD